MLGAERRQPNPEQGTKTPTEASKGWLKRQNEKGSAALGAVIAVPVVIDLGLAVQDAFQGNWTSAMVEGMAGWFGLWMIPMTGGTGEGK